MIVACGPHAAFVRSPKLHARRNLALPPRARLGHAADRAMTSLALLGQRPRSPPHRHRRLGLPPSLWLDQVMGPPYGRGT